MAHVLAFPRPKASHVLRLTPERTAYRIRIKAMPAPGSLVSCFYEGLWLVARYHPVGREFVRLVDSDGEERIFHRRSLEIEGEVMEVRLNPSEPISAYVRNLFARPAPL